MSELVTPTAESETFEAAFTPTLRDLDGKLICLHWSYSVDNDLIAHGEICGYVSNLENCGSVSIGEAFFGSDLPVKLQDDGSYRVRFVS
jgi:hypothetical protein